MNNYKVKGQSRQVGAIGEFEPFIVNIAAESSKEAYNKVREAQYKANREHVLTISIQVSNDDGTWTTVEPRAYFDY